MLKRYARALLVLVILACILVGTSGPAGAQETDGMSLSFNLDSWVGAALFFIVALIPLWVALWRGTRLYWAAGAVTLLMFTPLGWFAWLAALAYALLGPRVVQAVLLMALVGSVLVVSPPQAKAVSCYDGGPKKITVKNVTGNTLGWVSLRAHWCVKSPAECNSLYPCFGDIRWTKDYGEGIYQFDHWYSDSNGGGTNSNGTRWKSKVVTAQFEFCVVRGGIPACQHFDVWVSGLIYTNGAWYGNGGRR